MPLSEAVNLGDCEAAFGRAIRHIRENKRMTQAELAARIGRDEKSVAQIEDGEEALDLKMIVGLTVKGLGVRFGEVFHLVDQYLGRT